MKEQRIKELKLQVEELEERIAPAALTITPPAGPTGDQGPFVVDSEAVAADDANGVDVVG